jgi:hypothetical protein
MLSIPILPICVKLIAEIEVGICSNSKLLMRLIVVQVLNVTALTIFVFNVSILMIVEFLKFKINLLQTSLLNINIYYNQLLSGKAIAQKRNNQRIYRRVRTQVKEWRAK